MIEDIADPALLSPELASDEMPTALEEPSKPAVLAKLTELCLYMLIFYSAFVTLANRYVVCK